MPVQEGTNPGEFTPTVAGVTNGEDSSQEVLNRANHSLDNRCEALKTFANSEEVRTVTHVAASVAHGATSNLIGTLGIATVTNKAMTTTIEVECRRAQYSTLVGLASSAADGTLYQETDQDKAYYYVMSGVLTPISGSSAPGTSNILVEVNQTAHGFALLNTLYVNGGSFALAINTTFNNSALYVVVEVVDANNFKAALQGIYTIPSHGLTLGARYYSSTTTAGSLVTLQPITGIAQEICIPSDSDNIIVGISALKDNNNTSGAAPSDLDDLVDVTIATPQEYDLVTRNPGGTWENVPSVIEDVAVTHIADSSKHIQAGDLDYIAQTKTEIGHAHAVPATITPGSLYNSGFIYVSAVQYQDASHYHQAHSKYDYPALYTRIGDMYSPRHMLFSKDYTEYTSGDIAQTISISGDGNVALVMNVSQHGNFQTFVKDSSGEFASSGALPTTIDFNNSKDTVYDAVKMSAMGNTVAMSAFQAGITSSNVSPAPGVDDSQHAVAIFTKNTSQQWSVTAIIKLRKDSDPNREELAGYDLDALGTTLVVCSRTFVSSSNTTTTVSTYHLNSVGVWVRKLHYDIVEATHAQPSVAISRDASVVALDNGTGKTYTFRWDTSTQQYVSLDIVTGTGAASQEPGVYVSELGDRILSNNSTSAHVPMLHTYNDVSGLYSSSLIGDNVHVLDNAYLRATPDLSRIIMVEDTNDYSVCFRYSVNDSKYLPTYLGARLSLGDDVQDFTTDSTVDYAMELCTSDTSTDISSAHILSVDDRIFLTHLTVTPGGVDIEDPMFTTTTHKLAIQFDGQLTSA